jgi:DNA-binding HxlR family transcriptional regulator
MAAGVDRQCSESVETEMPRGLPDWLRDGLVQRIVSPIIPPHVEYALTPPGSSPCERIGLPADWAVALHEEILRHRAAFDAPR